jgi:hypothetical protein
VSLTGRLRSRIAAIAATARLTASQHVGITKGLLHVAG